MEQKLHDAASKLPEASLSFETVKETATVKTRAPRRSWRTVAAAAACFVALISVGLGTYAYAAEVREYNDAVEFFNEHDLSTDGLTRGEIKAVYRDITTKTFTYSKTAEVIENSLSADQVGGYEILQEDPTPEDVEKLWNYKNYNDRDGVYYKHDDEYSEGEYGLTLDRSYFEKYDGDTLVWSVSFTEFHISDHIAVSDGFIVYGYDRSYEYAWAAKISPDGALVWKQMLYHGFRREYIEAVLENADGSYALFSRGDSMYFCLSQYTADGRELYFQKTEVGNYGIWNVARFGEGYIVQLGSDIENEHARIVMADRAGNITGAFSYSGEDAYYYITDMIEFEEKIYLSAYAVPKLENEDQSAGGRYEIARVLNYIFDNKLWEISTEELTPMVRDNYTAMLLVCDPGTGMPQEFYSVKGSLGGKLALSDSGTLLWDVESITATYFSPATNAFTIGGTSSVFRYTFSGSGALISQEKTGEVVGYFR